MAQQAARPFWPGALIGVPGSRHRLVTPALVLDLDVAERNFARLRAELDRHGLGLRVNVKTHKSVACARFQLALGAHGVCCATLGEAWVMARAGIPGILLATPMTTAEKIAAVIEIARETELLLAVDHPDNADALSRAAAAAGVTLGILVDVDPGSRRTGVASAADAHALVRRIAAAPGLRWRGLQCYAGFVQHIENEVTRRAQNAAVIDRLGALVETLRAEGLAPEIVSGGGTGSFDLDGAARVFTESQSGSFMFMDQQYLDVWEKDSLEPPFAPALFVQTAVHSASHAGIVTTDAGSKRFATDGGRVVVVGLPGAEYRFHGDEHGKIHFADGRSTLAIGDRVECIVPHCDPTLNLYDRIHCVRGDTLVDVWAVDARGI